MMKLKNGRCERAACARVHIDGWQFDWSVHRKGAANKSVMKSLGSKV